MFREINATFLSHLAAWNTLKYPAPSMQMEPDPPSDRNKLNFDAAFKNQGTMAVVVSCNNQAQILKAWTKLFPKGDALWGEVMAALFAISCASEAGYSLIIIKGMQPMC